MNQKIADLNDNVRTMTASVNVYNDILNTVVHDDIEKQNSMLKMQLMRDQVLRSSMNVKKLVDNVIEDLNQEIDDNLGVEFREVD
jgi:hypothetical protein